MSRRGEIAMTPEELRDFLDEQRTVTCATNGRHGWPHVMPLWYVVRAGELWAWTYAKSQKVRNLERDGRATLQVETGDAYHELQGMMITATTVIHRDPEVVAGVGVELLARYSGTAAASDRTADPDPGFRAAIEAQAAKRVALQFVAQRTASWDHRKLGGLH